MFGCYETFDLKVSRIPNSVNVLGSLTVRPAGRHCGERGSMSSSAARERAAERAERLAAGRSKVLAEVMG